MRCLHALTCRPVPSPVPQCWKDIGKVLEQFNDEPFEAEKGNEALTRISSVFRFVLLLVGGNKTESHAESAWLISSKESFYHEHLDFGFADVPPSAFRGPRQSGRRLWLTATAKDSLAD
jgi:hypothetical protein